MGASPMHLPWSIIRRWAQAHRYGEMQAKFLDACICAMDDVFLDHHAEQVRIRQEAPKI